MCVLVSSRAALPLLFSAALAGAAAFPVIAPGAEAAAAAAAAGVGSAMSDVRGSGRERQEEEYHAAPARTPLRPESLSRCAALCSASAVAAPAAWPAWLRRTARASACCTAER